MIADADDLKYAAAQGDIGKMKQLIAAGTDVNSFGDQNDFVPLHLAASIGFTDGITLLLQNGANVNLRSHDGRTALRHAVNGGHVKALSLLLEAGADPNIVDHEGVGPLHNAASFGEEHSGVEVGRQMVRMLVEKGATVSTKCPGGYTPLHWAVISGQVLAAEVLLEADAASDVPDDDGKTPLFWSSGKGHPRLTEILIERGANVNSRTKNGETPLMAAAELGHSRILDILLEKGADVTAKDKDGRTAIEWAEKGQKWSVAASLRKAKAKWWEFWKH